MSTGPLIFISYAHKDEPDGESPHAVKWLTFVQSYLQPAVKHGAFEYFIDRQLPGSALWQPEIEAHLDACDIFVLLVSRHSMASAHIVDKEIEKILARQARGEPVAFYPIILEPTPAAAFDKIAKFNYRPRDGKTLVEHEYAARCRLMSDIADEIAALAANSKKVSELSRGATSPALIDIARLPNTGYENLVGRDDELKRLDAAWSDAKINIFSLVAEGGAGKSALVEAWLTQLQMESYRGAEAVLGWSFYSQGSKERATSSEPFLDWALEKLGARAASVNAQAKGEAIAAALGGKRVLLALDGVEPLQRGPGPAS